MANDFLPIVALLFFAAVLAVVLSMASRTFTRRRPDEVKRATYECGVAELESVNKRVSIRYYLTALTFIVFDVEIAFLYPWAVILKKVDEKVFLFFAMLTFLSVICLAYAWEWKKGALDWD